MTTIHFACVCMCEYVTDGIKNYDFFDLENSKSSCIIIFRYIANI